MRRVIAFAKSSVATTDIPLGFIVYGDEPRQRWVACFRCRRTSGPFGSDRAAHERGATHLKLGHAAPGRVVETCCGAFAPVVDEPGVPMVTCPNCGQVALA